MDHCLLAFLGESYPFVKACFEGFLKSLFPISSEACPSCTMLILLEDRLLQRQRTGFRADVESCSCHEASCDYSILFLFLF